MNRSLLITLASVIAVAAFAGCGSSSTKSSTESQERLTDLQDISQLQSAFRTASGRPRLIVLVSPT